MSFTLAIVGRPNVGKSTLLNRLAGKRVALVDDTPGVTRDRREADGRLGDLTFKMIDTAGYEEGGEGLSARMREQTLVALQDADVALFLIDGRAGLTALDRAFAALLRKSGKPALLVVNKCEGRAADAGLYESYELGLGEPIALSAEHGEGMAELYQGLYNAVESAGLISPDSDDDSIVAAESSALLDVAFPEEGDLAFEFSDTPLKKDRPLELAIVGRPNAGKSTLVNTLIGEERMITGPEAGITRDSIAVEWRHDDIPIRLVDTAGLRKRAKITEKLERLSAGDALRAVRFAEIVILLVDATLGIEKQDIKIASHVIDEGRGLVIALNKWDLVDDRKAALERVSDVLERSLPHLKGVRVIPISAREGSGLDRLIDAVAEIYGLWNSRIKTAEFNRWLTAVTDRHPPPMVKGRALKVRYGAQVKTRPPTFVLFVNRPRDVKPSYLRYLENGLREAFGLQGAPIRMLLRRTRNPYDRRS